MSDEGSKGPAPLQPERARPIGPAGPAASAAPSPVNRLHEWAAAAVIVVFSMLVLAGFVYFLRGGAI